MDKSLLIVMVIILLDALVCRVDILETFYQGVREGFSLFKTLFPGLMAFMLMVALLESSGIIGWLTNMLGTFIPLKMPSALIGLGLFRPISSSAAMAFLTEVFNQYGPDSLYGLMASLMQGATDTTFYVISIYLSQTHAKKSGYALPLCLGLDALALMLAIMISLMV